MFFGWTVQTNQNSSNPVKGTKQPKQGKGDAVARRAFTPAELQSLWRAAKANAFWRYMTSAGLYTGLRMGDLICLARSEVKLSENLLELTTRKTNTLVKIPIAKPLRAILDPLMRRSKGKYLWPEQAALYLKRGSGPFSNGFYDDVMVTAGLAQERGHSAKKNGNGRSGKRNTNELSFHCLRHSFISFLKISGTSGVVAKALAGHASDEVNELYTHVPPELMQAAIKQLPEVTI
jgi:integrase